MSPIPVAKTRRAGFRHCIAAEFLLIMGYEGQKQSLLNAPVVKPAPSGHDLCALRLMTNAYAGFQHTREAADKDSELRYGRSI